jgi:hypothetical protein
VSTTSMTLVCVFMPGDRRTSYVPRRFEQLHDPSPSRGAHVRVDLRGRHRLVPEQIANVPDVGAALEQLGRVGAGR